MHNPQQPSVKRQLHIGMSLAPTWLRNNGWRESNSQVEQVFTGELALSIAQRAEAAHLDFVFLPDVYSLPLPTLATSPSFASLDPTLLLASIARDTQFIGLVSTMPTAFLPPYLVARQIQSLNWLSRGRAAWNVVTGLQGHSNFSLSDMPSAEQRYAQAAEFVQIVKDLWGSFPHSALSLDRDSGQFADTSQVHNIDHHGTHYQVQGPLNMPAYSSRIPLVQAGASDTGRQFAASIADIVFAATPEKAVALELRQDFNQRLASLGRQAQDIRLLPGVSLYLAETEEKAQALFSATNSNISLERRIAIVKDKIGLDLTNWPVDKAITAADLPKDLPQGASHTHSQLLRRIITQTSPLLNQLLDRPEVISAAHWQIVGTVEQAFAEIKDWFEAGAIDGFVATPGGSQASLNLFFEQLVPMFVNAGLLRENYSGRTFIEHLSD